MAGLSYGNLKKKKCNVTLWYLMSGTYNACIVVIRGMLVNKRDFYAAMSKGAEYSIHLY